MIFMANLSANQTAAQNSSNVIGFIFHNTLKCMKLKCNTVNTHPFNNSSNDHCNTNKFSILHQNICGICKKKKKD